MQLSRSLLRVLTLTSITVVSSSLVFAEDWKGPPEPSRGSFGAITGLGIIDSSAGYSVLGTASAKIVSRGFIPDINNSVSIEGEVGPVFLSGVTAWAYSTHLRWDFEKDETWTLFALGGVGGNIMSVNGQNRFELVPRFGVGSFLKLSPQVKLRGEIAYNLIAVGVNIPF